MTRIASKTYRVTGIVLNKKNFFETDRIVEIFSLERGMVRAVVKGARRTSSKLAGSTELFTYGVFYIAKGKNLDIVTSVTAKSHFQKATSSLKHISQLFLISEVLTKLLPEELPNEALFWQTLKFFKTINKKPKPELSYEYLYKLIVLLGYGLSLTVCSKCHKKIENLYEKKNIFSLEAGGIICDDCSKKSYIQRTVLSKNCIKLLKYIENNDLDKVSKVNCDPTTANEVVSMVNSYLDLIYQGKMRSQEFIKSVGELPS